MGKGDQRSKRGKIAIGSFGRLRPRKKTEAYVATADVTSGTKTKKTKATK